MLLPVFLRKKLGRLAMLSLQRLLTLWQIIYQKILIALIEQSGYVNKSKYKALQEVADRLEKRIELLEESIK